MKNKPIFEKLYGNEQLDKPLNPYKITFNTEELYSLIEDLGIEVIVGQAKDSIEESIRGLWNNYNS